MDPSKEKKKQLVLEFSEILPNNDRVRNKLEIKRRKEEEEAKFNMLELARQRENDLINEELKKQNEEAQRKHLEEQRNLELDVRKALVSIEKGEGNMNEMLKQIYRNTSSTEINFSGLELNDWDFHGLMVILPDNMSLLTLNLSRKNLGDDKAKSICDMLKSNQKLRRLELEGNLFGPESCTYFGNALRKNKTLKYLDLENNCLTNDGTNIEGITELCEALKDNTTLISLNLSGNALDDQCSQKINSMLIKNHTLIHLELFNNQYFQHKDRTGISGDSKFSCIGASVEHLDAIKKKISENREKYNLWRLKEWKERKMINNEEADTRDLNYEVSQKKIEVQNKIQQKNQILDMYKDKFDTILKDSEEKFQKEVETFYISTKERLDKKKPKPKPVKKK